MIPTKAERITSMGFVNYKALPRFSLSLDHVNVITGANNSGKSTIIGALRTLSVALRAAKSRKPVPIRMGRDQVMGYRISSDQLPISLENIATDYADVESSVTFRISNGNELTLHLSREEGCRLIPTTRAGTVTNPTTFRSQFPIELLVVPVLGPVEHEEDLRQEDTVTAALTTHRASRHFRSYWYRNRDEFEAFAALVTETWDGMELKRPELGMKGVVKMFVLENRILRELYWMGFGFQIWCQLLTHLTRARPGGLIVLDEPETYLHPDVQRKILSVVKNIECDIIMATHSTEIIAEADPGDIVLVDKKKSVAERVKDIDGVQRAMNILGSQQNITLTALARHRKVVFVEGDNDFRILRRIAKQLGYSELAAGMGMTAMESGGFGSWQRISTLADGVADALGTPIMIGAVYDRDYFCDEQITQVKERLTSSLALTHVHDRKEIENYFLVPAALDRAIAKGIAERRSNGAAVSDPAQTSEEVLLRLSEGLKDDCERQYVSKYLEHFKADSRDLSTRMSEASRRFRTLWDRSADRWRVVSGKALLRLFREHVQVSAGITLSDVRIISTLRRDEIPSDLTTLIANLDRFREAAVASPRAPAASSKHRDAH